MGASCAAELLNAYANDCTTIASLYSDAMKGAIVSCAPLACAASDPLIIAGITTCIASKLSTTSAAQNKLATDFCATCMAEAKVSACVSAFYGSGGIGYGGLLLEDSDSVIDAIDATCVTGTSACGSFLGCAASVLESKGPSLAACPVQAPLGAADGG